MEILLISLLLRQCFDISFFLLFIVTQWFYEFHSLVNYCMVKKACDGQVLRDLSGQAFPDHPSIGVNLVLDWLTVEVKGLCSV